MPTKRTKRGRRILSIPLRPGEVHFLQTGEVKDFHAFKLDGDAARIKSILAIHRPGAFPWAERAIGGKP